MKKQEYMSYSEEEDNCEVVMTDVPMGADDEPMHVQLLPSSVFLPFSKEMNNTNMPLKEKYKPQHLLKAQTIAIVQTFKICSNGKFNVNMPKVSLTKPNETKPAWNNACDNEEGNLIVHVNDVLNERYIVRDLLGQGTFGQVFRCEDTQMGNKQVAVKIIKNKRAYVRQATMEKKVLQHLQTQFDPDDKHHIVRMLTHFEHCNHLCLVFEKLSINLFDLIKSNRFQGLSMNLIRVMASQVLATLKVLQKAKIIHCDLKPENILLTEQSPMIKVIDFGSACYETETTYMYIQSRFYRSPEVMLEMSYDMSIDMWSLGCICAELCLGLPLFPGVSQYNQLARMIEMLGYPPAHMIEMGKASHKYFKPLPNLRPNTEPKSGEARFQFKSEQEYCFEQKCEPKVWKRYFNYTKLDDLIIHYPYKHIKEQDRKKEEAYRYAFIDFLKGLLQYDPLDRWTPEQACSHPFITGKEFTGPFIPEPDTQKEQLRHRRRLLYQQQQPPVHPSLIQNYFDGPQSQPLPIGGMMPRSMPKPTPNSFGSGYPPMPQMGSMGGIPVLGSTPRSMSYQNAPLLGTTPSQSPLAPSYMQQAQQATPPYGFHPLGVSPPHYVPTQVSLYPADQVLPQESRQRRGSSNTQQKSPQQKSPHQFVPFPSPQFSPSSFQPSPQLVQPPQGFGSPASQNAQFPIPKKNGKKKRRNSQQQQQGFGSPASQPSTPTSQGIPIPHNQGSKPPRAPNSNPKYKQPYHQGTPSDSSPTDFYPTDGESLLTQELKQSKFVPPPQQEEYYGMQTPKQAGFQQGYNSQQQPPLLYGMSPMTMNQHMPQLGASLGTLTLGSSYPQNSPYGRGFMTMPQQPPQQPQGPSSFKGTKK